MVSKLQCKANGKMSEKCNRGKVGASRKRKDVESDDDDSEDETSSSTRLSDGKLECLPTSKWTYDDLKELKIIYKEEEDSIESMLEDLQKSYASRKSTSVSAINKRVELYKKITMDNLTFTFGLENIRKFNKLDWNILEYKMADVLDELNKNSSSVSTAKVDEFGQKWGWIGSINRFLRIVEDLAGRSLLPVEHRTGEVKRFQEAEEKLRKSAKKHKLSTSTKMEKGEDEMFFTNLCRSFGQIFFMDPSPIRRKPFVIRNKIVTGEPDLRYHLPRTIESSKAGAVPSVVSVVEVKQASIAVTQGKSLEGKLESQVLGQVGVELFAESAYSIFNPNSFGIVCIETKLIFVYLKILREHALNILENKPIVHESKIHYTREYDILKAEDRAKIIQLMYWLGCVQQNEELLLQV